MNLFEHQKKTVEFLASKPYAFISSDAGTGKSRCILERIREIKHEGRALIIAPKSILQPSWAADILKFTPELTYSIAYAETRKQAFDAETDIVLTNHDAVRWLQDNPAALDGFVLLCIDESTAYKNPTAQRSKALDKLAGQFKYRVAMTGTPTPNGLLDLWHQIKLVDRGQALGSSYWAFRAATHTPVSKGPFTEWEVKEGASDAVYSLISDFNIRYKLEDCLDMPENIVSTYAFDLSPKHLELYERLRHDALLELQNADITALNAASLATKLMQAASGSVYDSDGNSHELSTERYELVLDLVEERKQCLVAFQWKHQRDRLIAEARKRKLSFATIDGNVSHAEINDVVNGFQKGRIKVIFAHPKSAGHGLTLTAGTATIWASPTYNLEHYLQFNRRIYRAGQTQRTETIHIAANNTIDVKAYARLEQKQNMQQDLLELLEL